MAASPAVPDLYLVRITSVALEHLRPEARPLRVSLKARARRHRHRHRHRAHPSRRAFELGRRARYRSAVLQVSPTQNRASQHWSSRSDKVSLGRSRPCVPTPGVRCNSSHRTISSFALVTVPSSTARLVPSNKARPRPACPLFRSPSGQMASCTSTAED